VGERFDEPPRPNPEELARLQQIVPTIEGLRHSHLLLHGVPGAQTTQPAEAILHAAEKENVALIVLGTRGRTGLSRALMGSVAESVLRQAPCGVVVVKPASQD
jgi:nucleotide-binding universal stress UspA family protein